MSEPRDHHFVPQFLLAQWCNADDKLTVYSRPHHTVVTSELNPRSTGYERNLYAYTGLPPDQTQVVETQFMRHIDDAAAPVLRKLLAGGLPNLTSKERSDFTWFILSLRVRHPDAISLSKNEGERTLTVELERDPDQYLAARGSADPETLKDFLEQNAPHVMPNFGLSLVPKVIMNKEAGERVFAMPWSTFDVRRSNLDLLTSDRPCILEGDALAGPCVIALPLSPRMVLVVSNQASTIDHLHRRRQPDLVKLINRGVVRYAKKYVYATGGHHRPLIEKWLGPAASGDRDPAAERETKAQP